MKELNWFNQDECVIEKIGYHTTSREDAKKIKENGFRLSEKNNEWLGAGIYFWEQYSDAIWWKQYVKGSLKENNTILKYNLKCDEKFFLDLTDKKKMEEYLNFVKKFNKEKFKKKKIKFKNKEQYRNYYLNIYAEQNEFKILTYDFENEKYHKGGFLVRVVQYCVKDNSCLKEIREGDTYDG